MPSYRFCRPDDIPYLVRAVNECYTVHFAGLAPWTVEEFRDEMKLLDAWPSNSMVASTNAGPVAVMIGTKRAQEVMISRVGVHPEHLRQGHGGHLFTSLSQKLAVLGPERLIAEAPLAIPGITDFLESLEYRPEIAFTDYTRPPAPVEPVPEEWILPTTVDELIDQELLVRDRDLSPAWERAHQTLVNSKEVLEGLAVASAEQLEAYLLYRETTGRGASIVSIGGRESGDKELFLTVLLRYLAGKSKGPLHLPKLAENAVPSSVLTTLGFEPGDEYVRYAAVATPA